MKSFLTTADDKQSRSSDWDGTFLYVGIFVAALVLRVLFVGEWEQLPYGKVPMLDADSYNAWAKAIAEGHLLRSTAFYQSPLYPYLLGFLYKVFGPDTLIAGLVNASFGAAAVTFLSALARKYFGVAAALVTGILGAFYQPFVFYAVPLMKEALGFFLLAAFLFFAFAAFEKNRMRDYLACGMFLALATLTRGNVAFLLPVFSGLATHAHQNKAYKNVALFLAFFCLCLLPATLHNVVASGEIIPVNYADGFNLYVGHSPFANGLNSYPPGISTNPAQEEIETGMVAQEHTGQSGPSAVSGYWRGLALDYMVANPLAELGLLIKKFSAFWSNQEAFDNHNVTFIRGNFDTVLSLTFPWFGLISSLAAFTVVAEAKRRKNALIVLCSLLLAYMASLLVFYVTERYRLPAVVFLLPLAGAALPAAFRLYREKKWRRLAFAFFTSSCFVILAYLPIPAGAVSPPAFNWGLLCSMYVEIGEDQKAVDALHKALALSPQDAGFLPISRGAEAEHRLGNEAESVRLFTLATELFPKTSGAWFYFGTMKERQGDLRSALKAYQKAVQFGPSYSNSYVAQARVYEKLGKKERANEMFRRAINIDPALADTLRRSGAPRR